MPEASRPHGPRPLKELGQHFLLDEEIAFRIVRALELSWEDRALEIGPGRGVLLRFLLKECHKVAAIEIDTRLKKPLEKTFGGHPGLDLIFGDFLQFDLMACIRQADAPLKIVGNIPYSLSAPILFHLFEIAAELQNEADERLFSATLTLQREVAERISARPGGRETGGITIFRELVADAELLFHVPAAAFHPPPKVTSSVVRLNFYPEVRYRIDERFKFRQLVQHVFKQRRKMLKNSIGGLSWIRPGWHDIDFDLTRRPEVLSTHEFIRLFDLLQGN